ncbi:carbohydrate ABC transporter permease [Labrys wisconsinensis]|uniref:ABC-type glycerol-3-phosphate transport system permease component n=1 Tax=Labrys wisconsinensis TaxID=425677 RepID=A0ABU0JMK7_9HYPH|nr:carbohydrate ABC transporter permease [Labrys wisconsinensis]MDQ0474613.1 ABC-type glycerol-3-phosphate transport system permease component [Labrys wisconsinensis]
MHRPAAARLLPLAVVVFAAVLTLYPIAWMVSAAFKTNAEIFSTGLGSMGSAGWSNFTSSFGQRPFLTYLLNSVLAALVSVAVTIVLGALAGYSLAKFSYRGAGLVGFLVFASVMIPLEAIVIPLFLEIHALGWANSYAALLLPTAFNVVGIFILRQAMLAIPDAYIEAARIDGASEWRILVSIVMPMVLPSVVVVAVLTFNLNWNSYLWPLIVASDDSLRTLPLGMAAFQSAFNTQYGQVMAVSIFGAVPTTLFFAAFQKHFIEGAVAAGIK